MLLRLADADERTLINRAKAIAATVQRRDVALLLDGHPELVARAGADGAHLSGIEAFAAALPCSSPTASPAPAACTAVMMPCSPARLAPIT